MDGCSSFTTALGDGEGVEGVDDKGGKRVLEKGEKVVKG